MRDTFPSARFLAIAASGEFTEPARDYVKSRGINLFFVPKAKVVDAFAKAGLSIDYSDRASEDEKNKIASAFQRGLDYEKSHEVALKLRGIVGDVAFTGFVHTVISALSAQAVEIEIRQATLSEAAVFKSIREATEFLLKPSFEHRGIESGYTYKVTYSDGSEFFRSLESLTSLQELNSQLLELLTHMESVAR